MKIPKSCNDCALKLLCHRLDACHGDMACTNFHKTGGGKSYIHQQANHKICTCHILEHVDYGRKAVIEIDRSCPSHGVQTS